jgi:signal transduction histidine kinase
MEFFTFSPIRFGEFFSFMSYLSSRASNTAAIPSPKLRFARFGLADLDLEDKISPYRVACLVSALAVYFGFHNAFAPESQSALLILSVASLYVLSLHFFKLHRRLSAELSNVIISVCDGIAVVSWVWVTGGMYSSFFVFFYGSITTVALRFSMVPTMMAAGWYSAMYAAVHFFHPSPPLSLSHLLIRTVHIFLVGAIGSMVASLIRDRSEKTAGINHELRNEIIRHRKTERMLRRKQQELAGADVRKDEFLAMLAHELRNPLATMYAAVELLSQSDLGKALREEALDSLQKRLQGLVHMVDDLLEVSRVTKGKILLARQRVNLGNVLNQSIAALRDDFERSGHFLHFDPSVSAGIFVFADPTRLEQIFMNLIQNAVKYTDPRGHIWVSVSYSSTDVTVQIKDSGIGMESEMLDKVFGLFVQGENTLDRSRGGLGIGLTLVKTLVEQHGGSIHASSNGVGTGSEFSVRLPVAEIRGPVHPSESVLTEAQTFPAPDKTGLTLVVGPGADQNHNRSIKTLLVEDSPDVALLLSALLRRWGYPVEVATDGEMALQMFRELQPRIVLLDIGLPKVDGYEVARRIRNDHREANPILIAMTGYGRAVDKERAKACGFDLHLTKPVPPPLLKRVLGEAVEIKHSV